MVEPLLYFRVFHGTPTNKNEINMNYLEHNEIFLY